MNASSKHTSMSAFSADQTVQDPDASIREKQVLLSLIRATSRVRDTKDLVTLFSKKIRGLGHHYDQAQILLLKNQHCAHLSSITQGINHLLKSHPEAHLSAVYLLDLQDAVWSLCTNATAPFEVALPVKNGKKADPATRALHELVSELMINKDDHQMQRCLIMPLKDRDMLMGLLLVASKSKGRFTAELCRILQEIAPLLSNALLNIIDHADIRQKNWEESFLLDFSGGIAAVRTKGDLASVIYTFLKKLSMVQAYFIRLINEVGGELMPFMHDNETFYHAEPRFKALLNEKISPRHGISGRVLKSEGPVVIDFLQEIANDTRDPYVEFWKKVARGKPGFEKMTGAALRVGSRNIGILWIITEKIDTRLLEGICAQISIAISNIKANEEILRREQEKETLLSLSQEMAALRERNDLFQKFYTKVTSVLGIEEFGMVLLDREKNTYSIIIDEAATFARLHPGHEGILDMTFKASDPVFQRISGSKEPVYFDVATLSALPDMPAYVHFWQAIHLKRVAGTLLKVGGEIIGAAFFHVDPVAKTSAYSALLQSVSHQLAVAISNIYANEQVLQYKQMLEMENVQLKNEINSLYNFSEIIGSGERMQEVYRLIRLVATTDSTVLILGETGTGKELIARAIHNASPRKDKLMIKVNCAALPANLIESELFGHEKGAFTGAIERRIGKFELAAGGTIFLDEIGEMPLETQVKLLRVIQEREFERVGGKSPIKVDVRIIAATNRKLDIEVNEGRFRPDLYYRLNVFPIHLPALRDRTEDMEALTRYFVQKYSKRTGHAVKSIAAVVFRELRSYSWPGNVRELEHLIERSILLMEGSVLKRVPLPLGHVDQRLRHLSEEKIALKDMETTHIIDILKKSRGKIAGVDGAARRLGIPPTTLHSKIKKLGIKKRDYLS
ncbi:sigma 54-interacting transcriptional regulator [Arachidicoccus terrestris]|uniref:sigma 54-interacting transcriptional regulator n=1 Tax=Arachidicoccus terrestris TaxID=2875539 RepID=UPI001CC33898|nr:sigma 54-interacting transcriptional regulator [Arachidicoccus terrestris]UAY55317.1 sigma 54-interacting transcriptional regulator [Arachidicoccus terrestris]